MARRNNEPEIVAYGYVIADKDGCCSGCSETVKKSLADREHVCPNCGRTLGRDHNAAINILRLGESLAGLVPSERAEVLA